MTNKELQSKLKEVTNKDWFKSVSIIFNFSKVDSSIEKISFFSIYQYVKKQVNGWEKLSEELPNDFIHSRNKWKELLNGLEVFLSQNKYKTVDNEINSQWNYFKNKVKEINNYFPIDCPETIFLLEVFKISPNYYNGAQKYLTGNSSMHFNNKAEFAGAIMAYEFNFKEDSLIPKRRNSEKSSISQIRNSFENELSKTRHEVNDFLQTSENNWKSITEQISNKAKNQNEEVDNLIRKKQKDYDKWFNESKKNEETYTKQSLERVKELEELYREKLKLEAPATYWKSRADKLKEEGRNWLIGLVIVSAIAIIALGLVLYLISDGTLKDLFEKTGSAIRWSIVFVTFVSFLAYGIRTFAKLMFSAYHLHRDAEEREQLAYVYLALNKEQSVDKTERHLIMQSLFSRADSGLLKDESSPTMPGGNFIEKLMGGK